MKQARSKETQLDDWLIDRFEFVVQATGTLVIRPKVSTLDRTDLQQVCKRILETDGLRLSRILFDFSTVTELSGSWSIHFGLLIRLAREVAPRVSVTGLRGQPASAAWVYRHSPDMRVLLDEPHMDTAPALAAAGTTQEQESAGVPLLLSSASVPLLSSSGSTCASTAREQWHAARRLR